MVMRCCSILISVPTLARTKGRRCEKLVSQQHHAVGGGREGGVRCASALGDHRKGTTNEAPTLFSIDVHDSIGCALQCSP